MMGVPLRIAGLTGQYERMLRRFTFGSGGGTCESGSHGAHVIIGRVGEDERAEAHGDRWPHDDVRWPKACAGCGREFEDGDQWQLNDNRVCRLPDGTEFVFWGSFGRSAPPGTMLRAEWYDEFSDHPDGIESWIISLPDGGEWITSQRASGGGYWTVTGTPPLITASPSVWHNSPKGWHGWVRNGELVDALWGRCWGCS